MSTDYTNVNGYLVPSFVLPTGSTPPLGKYGAMRARFLDEHRPFERDQICSSRIISPIRSRSSCGIIICGASAFTICATLAPACFWQTVFR